MLAVADLQFQKYVKSIRLRPHDMFVHEVRMFQKYVKSIRLRPQHWIF